MNAKRIAEIGMMVGLAMVLSYLESLLPVSLGIPGVKLGLSNVVTLFALYRCGSGPAFGIAVTRIVLCGVTFGSFSAMLYSLAGGLLSYLVMLLLKKTDRFSVYGVSVAGGVFHNIGQVAVAAWVLQTSLLFYYIPFLLIAGTIAGVCIGVVCGGVIKRIQNL